MTVEIEGKVGQNLSNKGNSETPALGNYSESLVSELQARFFELTRSGKVFTIPGSVAGAAGVAANVSPLAAATGIPIIGLYNPIGSGKVAAIISAQFIIAAVADTAIGLPVWNVIPPAAAPGIGLTAANIIRPIPNLIGQGGASAMQGVNTALAGSVAATFLRHFAPDSVQVAVATATAFTLMTEKTDGRILVPPGAFAGIALSAAGTTYNVSGDLEFAELDWPLL
jgi:hypothetical protein